MKASEREEKRVISADFGSDLKQASQSPISETTGAQNLNRVSKFVEEKTF